MNCDFSVSSMVEAPVAPKPILTPTRLNNAARSLEEMGWRMDVAGMNDFNAGVDAFLECVFSSPPKGLLISGNSKRGNGGAA